MLKRSVFVMLLLVTTMILAACAQEGQVELPGAEEPITGPDEDGELPTAAVLEAQQALATQLGVTAAEIEVVETEQVEWPDACLGLPQEGEMCAQVITPGWRAVFEVNGERYVVHTDETGNNIRFDTETLG